MEFGRRPPSWPAVVTAVGLWRSAAVLAVLTASVAVRAQPQPAEPPTAQPAPPAGQPAPNPQPADTPEPAQPSPEGEDAEASSQALSPEADPEAPQPPADEQQPPADTADAETGESITVSRQEWEELKQRLDAVEQMSAESLGASVTADVVEAEDTFRTYGFMDVGWNLFFIKEGTRFANLIDDTHSFVLGNVNYYFDAQPVPEFRALSEVRFTLYPHGQENDNFVPRNTDILDVTSSTGRNHIRWGAIVLERAWIEWNRYAAATVRVGHFLTPYGIWNVDHGAPTLIASLMPTFFANEYFPTYSTGVQVLGNLPLPVGEVDYAAYVTNGRNPAVLDTNNNKNVGGRLAWSVGEGVRLKLGTSGYVGSYTDRERSIESFSPFRVAATRTVDYDEWGAAVDVSLDAGATRVRAEGVMHRRDYTEGLRERIAPGILRPDQTKYNGYVLVAHELPWWGLEPLIYVEHEDRLNLDSDNATIVGPGLNVRFNAAAHVKLQYFSVMFGGERDDQPSDSNFQAFNSRFVLAF